MAAAKVLLVDDEQRVLASLTRELMELELCQVVVAHDGQEGLEVLKKHPDVDIVCSDYRMPLMNGVDFLAQAQKINLDATRIMLTGATDLETAIDAVNRGRIFRFLVKPCPSDVFIGTIKDGIRQHQLVTAERELLSKTLNSSIKIMLDILSILSPDIFTQSTRLRSLAHDLATAIHYNQVWEVDLTAMLSQIGAVAVPKEILDQWRAGAELDENQKMMIDSIPHLGYQLVKNIPRLENIADAIDCQECPFCGRTGSPAGESIPVAARILKIILDYNHLEMTIQQPELIYKEMARNARIYDPFMLEVFRHQILKIGSPEELKDDSSPLLNHHQVRKVRIEDLQPGMVLLSDIVDRNGRLVITKGTTITEVHKYRLIYFFWNQSLYAPVFVEDMVEDAPENPDGQRNPTRAA